MYNSYVTASEYTSMGYSTIPATSMNKYLLDASRNADKLTFNRIIAIKFEKLTEFQQTIIKEVVCKQADFLYSNKDAIASIISSYSINGVSMQFGTGFNIKVDDGIPMQSDVYSLLEQTGLCWRGAR